MNNYGKVTEYVLSQTHDSIFQTWRGGLISVFPKFDIDLELCRYQPRLESQRPAQRRGRDQLLSPPQHVTHARWSVGLQETARSVMSAVQR